MFRRLTFLLLFSALTLLTPPPAAIDAQTRVTTPREQFGRNIGDDYFLVNYRQMVAYWKRLDEESDRMSLVEIGRTAEGRAIVMAIVTSAENQKNLTRYKDIARRLAKAESLAEEEARRLADEGKAVVWINGGLHANEVLGSQQLIEMVYQLASGQDAETMRILRDVIVLACIANPDGMDLVSDWYMQEPQPEKRVLTGLPRLYQKHAGHDNNRDFYMLVLPESRALSRVLFREWFPQIVYDHHQTGPAGAVMFSPPFRDPFNYNIDPLVMTTLEEIGGAMHSRFVAEDKPGVTTRSGANYSAWWNGGLRTAPYFHNMIGILTETIGHPTPTELPFVVSRQLADSDLPFPAPAQKWRFRQSIEYSLTANRAILDFASRNKDRLLYNIYRMGRNSIERGSRDHWTVTPRDLVDMKLDGESVRNGEQLRRQEDRDPRGYIIPSDQPDFLTAVKFVNALIRSGVSVMRATAGFDVDGKEYPEGSYVIRTAQAFRPHILDMFEPQDHPDDFAYAGAPPTPPYDSAGWTLAFQMGVQFDRILEGFDGRFEAVHDEVRPPPGTVVTTASPAGYLFTHEANDSFVAVNRLLAGGETVYWLTESQTIAGKTWPAGAHYVEASESTLPKLQQAARDVGLNFVATPRVPEGDALKLHPVRIGLWDRYGGSIASGWTQLVLEQFEFPYTLVYAPTLDAGGLADKFDVLILVDDALDGGQGGVRPEQVPPEYRGQVGGPTGRTLPNLKRFVEEGGAILALGRSTNIAARLGLPLASALVERQNGVETPLPNSKFYVPGSILQGRADLTHPLAYGLPEDVDLFFNRSPAFRILGSARQNTVRRVAWFDSSEPLRSGWAWGQSYLKDAIAVAEASVGKGRVVLYGPEIVFRSQSHGAFKLLFNGIYWGGAERVELP